MRLVSTRKLLIYAGALACSVVLNFMIPRLMPGSPVDSMIAQLGQNATPEAIDAIRTRFGASEAPVLQQFISYVGGLLRFDLGQSIRYYPDTVTSVLGRALGWTALLVLTAVCVGFCLGVTAGAIAAWRRGSRYDAIVSPMAVFLIAMPGLVLSLAALFIFGVSLRWLPVGYAYNPQLDPAFSFAFVGSVIAHAILPVLALLPFLFGQFLITMRSSMVAVLNEDYVTMARAKGLGRTRIVFSYAARNAMLPVLTNLALMLGAVFGGSVIVEVVFNYPGLGLTLRNASSARDYPVIQGQLLIMTLATLGANLVVDIIYGLIDPRLAEGDRA